jgi:predicted secreted Zn-dependent protease
MAATFAWLPAEAGIKTSTSVRYYIVGGTTTASLARAVSANPLHGGRGPGKDSIANLESTFDLSLEADYQGSTCNATGANINARFVITLPQASEASMTPPTRRNWRQLVDFARRHEEAHRSIYMGCFNDFIRQAKTLRSASGCETLKASAQRTFNAAMKICERKQDALDARDSRRLERLPLFKGH